MPELIGLWILLPFIVGLVYYAGRLSARVDEHDRRIELIETHYTTILEGIARLRMDFITPPKP